jgi:tetratricopeptide (TPR) repeat protein
MPAKPLAKSSKDRAGATASPAILRRALFGAAALLALGTFLLYLPTLHHEFLVGYDDDQYLTENGVVPNGLTLDGVRWAFTTTYFTNWLPLTWLSHMLAVSIFGMSPGGHHAINALLHAVNAGLLLLCLFRLTDRFWPSVVAATLFAVHPLRVESVAWIAERKDVLSGLFFILSLMAYARYVRTRTFAAYALILLWHALGLMSKTMAVTLPGVLFLLDVWPLRRWEWKRAGWLILEKIPFVLLSIVASISTMKFQAEGGAIGYGGMLTLTLWQRLANAVVGVARYLEKTFVPINLAVLYPHPTNWPVATVVASGLLVLAISVLFFVYRRRAPYLLVGWLWFLGMLLPVSGVVAQVGLHSIADRYTYLPGIGLTIAVVWLLADALRPRMAVSARPALAGGIVGIVSVIFAVCTIIQEGYWVNRFTLFSHAAAVTEGSWLAESFVGTGYFEQGDLVEAERHFRNEIAIVPRYANAHANLGKTLAHQGRHPEALAELRTALELEPGNVLALVEMGRVLLVLNRAPEALPYLQEAVVRDPKDGEARARLAEALTALDRYAEAVNELRTQIMLRPNSANAHYTLGNALRRANHPLEAIASYRKALEINPHHALAAFNLGSILTMQGKTYEAVDAYRSAVTARPEWVDARVGFGEALLQMNRIEEASEQAFRAMELAPQNPRVRALVLKIKSIR